MLYSVQFVKKAVGVKRRGEGCGGAKSQHGLCPGEYSTPCQ